VPLSNKQTNKSACLLPCAPYTIYYYCDTSALKRYNFIRYHVLFVQAFCSRQIYLINLISAFFQEAEADRRLTSGKRKCEQTVPSDYHLKYEHLLGKNSAKDAAQATSANRSYGFGNY